MKCSFGLSDFLKEISSLSHSVVFLYFFALITEEGFFNLSLLFFGTLHSNGNIFPLLLCFSLLFFCFSYVQVFVALWTVARLSPLSMGFFRQGYRSGLLYSPPGDLPELGIEPMSLMSPALADGLFTTSATWIALLLLLLLLLSHFSHVWLCATP